MKSLLLSLGSLGLVACNLERGGSRVDDRGTSLDGVSADAATGSSDGDAGSASDAGNGMIPIGKDPRDVVIGHYAERRMFRTLEQTAGPRRTDDVKVLTTRYALVEILRMGSRYVFRENACRIMVDNDEAYGAREVRIADAVPQSAPRTASELLVKQVDGMIIWERPLTSSPAGFIPSGPSDELPASASDPRVRDSEGDGYPGVTARVTMPLGPFDTVEGDVYLTQWNRARQTGVRLEDGSLAGENFDRSEERVIGADNEDLAGQGPSVVPDPNTGDNRILLVPLATPMTCDTLLNRLDELFPSQNATSLGR